MKNKLFKTTSLMMMAAYLFYPGGVQAQDAKQPQKFHIVMETDENGEKTRIDTTFSSEEELDAFMKSSGMNVEMEKKDGNTFIYKFGNDDGDENENVIFIDHKLMKEELEHSEKELKRSRKEIKDSEKEIQEALKKLHEMNIEMEDIDGVKRMEIIFDRDDQEKHWIQMNAEGAIDLSTLCEDLKNNFFIADDANPEVIVFLKKKGDAEIKWQSKGDQENIGSEESPSISETQNVDYRIPDSNVNIYPNPTNGTITLNFEPVNNKPVDVKIIDSRGRTIISDTFTTSVKTTKDYQLENYTKGTYLMQIRQGDHWKHEKIILR